MSTSISIGTFINLNKLLSTLKKERKEKLSRRPREWMYWSSIYPTECKEHLQNLKVATYKVGQFNYLMLDVIKIE